MRPSSSIGKGNNSASPSSTSSPASSRASSIESSVAGFSTSSTITFEAESSIPVSEFQSTWMSSPERNCFLAAARTASFIASITRSRSIPCSWQSASMFCAIDELISVSLFVWLGAGLNRVVEPIQLFLYFSLFITCASQFRFDIHLEVGLRDDLERHSHAPISSVFKDHFVTVYAEQLAANIALAVDRLPGFQLRVTTGEAFVVGTFIQTTFQPRRRYFQCVGSVDEVFDVQNRAQMRADFRTILVGYTLGLVNEDTNNGLVLGAGNFRVHQLEAMVESDSFSQFLNSSRNRIVPHCHLRTHPAQKKKWAGTHRTRPRAFEQAVNYTERVCTRHPATAVSTVHTLSV